MDLFVKPDGTIAAIYDETISLISLGPISIVRASRVEPDQFGKWSAEIINGPNLGPFARRSDALAAEVDWLTKHRLPSS